MRWTWMAMLACIAATSVVAQEKRTLIDDEDVWKLYTRPSVKISEVGGDDAAIGELGIGTTMNDQLHIGAAADILFNDTVNPDTGDNIDRWDFWYAGLDLGYTFAPESLVHVTVNTIVGGGSVKVEGGDSEGFWIIEPGIAACINVSERVELGVGATYRFVSGADAPGLDDDELNEASGNIFFRVHEY